MKTINIIGSGNVAYHLMENIDTLPDFRLQQVAVRSKEKVLDLVSEDLIVTDIKNLNPADLTIIAVTDDRSEERRVGKECRSGWSALQYKKKRDHITSRLE